MILLLASIIVSNVVSVADVPNPRDSNHWVTDQANVLDAAAEARIDATAEALKTSRGIELAVVTVDDTSETPKAFATALFNRWGIGSAQTNNGVLVLLVMGKRRLEIETGTGIEAALPPEWLSDMQAREMVPKFKSKDFGGGLVAGVEAIAAHLRDAPGESNSNAAPGEYRSNGRVVDPDSPASGTTAPGSTGPQSSYTPPSEPVSPVLPFALGGLGALAATGGIVLVRRRRRTCRTCEPSRPMIHLDEAADDAHLDEGQLAEEKLSSVDYDVFICPGCQGSRTFRRSKWFSGYDKCAKCKYKTSKSTSTTIVTATYDHGGQVRIDEHCEHCGHSSSRTRNTAARTRPSTTSYSSSSSSRPSYSSSSSSRSSYSSSSSSRSSYSGGSSRGGGSGSSW